MEPNDKEIDELLIDYALGQLDPAETRRVELMLAERPELMREARALKRMVSRMGVSMIMPPPKLVSRTRHAAYEARAKRHGWRGILPAALRKPVTVAAAGLVVVALVVALVGPTFWSTSPEEGPTPYGVAATISADLNSFLESNLEYMRALARGEPPDLEDFSVAAAQATKLAERTEFTDAQLAVLEDIEAVWRHGYNRVNSVGYLSDKIIVELKGLAAKKHLVERIEALLRR